MDAIGKMRHRIRFLQPSVTLDSLGGEVIDWNTTGEYWAHVEPRRIQSEEEVIADRLTATTAGIVTLRYQAVNPKWKMIFDGAKWEILSVLHDSHKNYTVLEVEQIIPET